GVNAHVVLEEYVAKDRRQYDADLVDSPSDAEIILLSAKTGDRLKDYANNLLQFVRKTNASGLEDRAGVNLLNLSYTLQVGRDEMAERLGLIVHSMKELEEKLQAFIDGVTGIEGLYHGQVNKESLSILSGDEDLQKAMDAWLVKKKYNKLLDLWVKGGVFD